MHTHTPPIPLPTDPPPNPQQYFKDLYATLRVGPPLYLVVRGLNLTAGALDANKVCSIAGCQKDSLLSRVSPARAAPRQSGFALQGRCGPLHTRVCAAAGCVGFGPAP